jgi:hypothetical protein
VADTKVCSVCGKEKPIGAFYFVRKDSDKRQSRCKLCDNRSRVARQHVDGADRGLTGKHCPLCLGMSWRVQGPRCRRCGLEHREEVIGHA